MIKKKISSALFAFGLLAFAATQVSCLDDMYNSSGNKTKLPGGIYEFGFQTRGDVKLTVNYSAPVQALIQVFNQDPLQNGVLDKNIKPIFAAYTNENGAFTGNMYVPTGTKEAWLYTDQFGLPKCVKMSTDNGGFVYDINNAAAAKSSRATDKNMYPRYFSGSAAPYDIMPGQGQQNYLAWTNGSVELKTLHQWTWTSNPIQGASTMTYRDGKAKELVGDIAERVKKHIDASADKPSFLRDADVTNIQTKENDTELSVVFLGDRAAYNNTMGYYYYKPGNEPRSVAEWHKLPKFIVYSDASTNTFGLGTKIGESINLQFFGDDYKTAGITTFPAGYIVGWFFISDGVDNTLRPEIKHVNVVESVQNEIVNRLTPMFFSNDTEARRRFISVQDQVSGLLILGFEDQKYLNSDSEDYSDVLFYVKSSKDIDNPDRPVIPDPEQPEEDTKNYVEGTLCFEDIWPSGGDYDMNDVAVEYTRTIFSDKNNSVTKIVETFKATQPVGSAFNENFFAYRAEKLGEVTLPAGCVKEDATSSIVITSMVKDLVNETYTIERTFAAGELSLADANKDFDPYIIVREEKSENPKLGDYPTQNRKEVHLPKKSPTALADKSLTETADDAYYMNVNGKYTFAIDIPVLSFQLATERVSIDADTEYPQFRNWADSKGTQSEQWYLHRGQAK